MPLFGLSDIRIDKGITSTRGPLASLVSNEYATSFLKYPLDIGSADKGHYMVIYIRKQSASKIQESNPTTSVASSLQGDAKKVISGYASDLNNKVNNGLDEINRISKGFLNNISSSYSGLTSLFGQTQSFNASSKATQEIIDRNIKSLESSGNLIGSIRPTKLTKDFIALYMPDTLQFTYSQQYETLSLGNSILGQLGAAGVSAADQASQVSALSGVTSAVKGVLSNILKEKAGSAGALAAYAATGAVVNPLLEVLYQSPQFRNFQYDFLFYPRSEREAVEVQKIINMLQYHQAPEFQQGGGVGLLIPPSEFDIKFYYAGTENSNIPKIGTCVLKTIDVNYAPNGFSAYEIPGQNASTVGGTGMPVTIQLTLQFQEITYLTKNKPGDVVSGSGGGSKDAGYNQVDAQGKGLF